ncbi:Uncharacterized conserved protein, DUF2249 family [Bowdeniella nasicola]|uniref:Uncharacterized conserved protein, DUF2249 family n=2 Tax=Bowdeniella nasicola TaxID=208480 RepID=A0A1H3WY31_9ACTO|nr:Uncharacterized conserved protein, DUF2249 family [Bowdeniella nasicola]
MGMTHTCGCQHTNLLEETIDVLAIPHSVRHAAILGAVSSLPVGATILIKAPHVPTPLLNQITELEGEWAFEMVQEGPTDWIVRVARQS